MGFAIDKRYVLSYSPGVRKFFDWNVQKNELLKLERDICFEDVVTAIESGDMLDVIENPNKNKYPDQRVFIVNIDNYAYVVPYIEDEEKYFLKTIFPSRKMTKKYLLRRRK